MTISIDVWGTLIKANPLFSNAKIKFIQSFHPEITDKQINEAFNETKKQLNSIIEITGWQPSKTVIYDLLFNKLNSTITNSDSRCYDNFILEYNKLFLDNNPIIYSDITEEYLMKLSNVGCLVISSNTMFINGNTLYEALEKLNLTKYFSNFLFSSELKYSKPNVHMYGGSDFHIGDNIITDGLGATKNGIQSIIINSNSNTIKDAYDIIIKS